MLQIGDLRPLGHVGAWIRTRQRVPYVLYVHGKDLCKEERKSHNSILKRAIGSEILGRAAAIIANSRFTAERARELMERVRIQHDDRVHVVHPGADPDRFRPDPVAARSVRRRLSIGGRSMILTVARLVPRKGVDMLLAALPAIAVRRRDVVLVVAGDGPDRARLESEARRLRLSERVAFLGTVGEDELPRLYAAADVFALPAREERAHDEVEGFGIVFCEAAASGLAVVAGDSGGVAEAVRDGETGVLVPPRDPRAIAEAVAGLLENDADRRSMGAAGRRAVRTYYNWDRAAEEAWRVITGAARCALRQTV